MKDGYNLFIILMAGFLILSSLTIQVEAAELTTIRVASGLALPVLVTSAPGDSDRIFIVEQNSGKILILLDGAVSSTPFLDISARVGSSGYEQGLLGMAFHPDYEINRFFYVDYTNQSGNTVIARYQTSDDPDIALFDSEQILLTINQPYTNHNGGMLAFGSDGYFYIGTGDGGSGFDPLNNAQTTTTMLGKMLRIDVDAGTPYAIPPDNPFVSSPNVLDEIWAIGLRNPWRYSFDRETGDLYIGDVGQNQWEEIDFQSGASTGGENYGWRIFEGTHTTGLTGFSSVVPDTTWPILEYQHLSGACSVTGGYVYRGNDIPGLQGTYFFADFCNGQIWSFRYDGQTMTEYQERTDQLAPGGGLDLGSISSFGEDHSGELYLCDLNGGEIFKIVPAVQINMTPQNPPVQIPGSGGSFMFDIDVENHKTQVVNFDVWIDVELPDGSVVSPLISRTNLQLGSQAIISRADLIQTVPSAAPAGSYTYRAWTGNFPDDPWSVSTFTFEKLEALDSDLKYTTWTLFGWESILSRNEKSGINIAPGISVTPNPFNPVTVLSLYLPTASKMTLTVYDLLGREVTKLVDGFQPAGDLTFTFDGASSPSGIYLYQLVTSEYVETGKLYLVK